MVQGTVKGTDTGGYISQDETVDPALLGALATELAPMRTSVGTRVEVLLELTGIKAAIRTWHTKQPDQILREASAYSARLTELWTELRLLEPKDREYTQLRTMQVTPVLEEIGRQFEYAKSRIALMRQDLDLLR